MIETEQAHSQDREAANERSKGLGRTESRKCPDCKLTEQERQTTKKKRGRDDVEIDRRVFRGHSVVLLEDRSMIKPDGRSGQYIIAVESVSKDGNVSLGGKRHISDLIKKLGYANAYEGARAVFLNPESFWGILGGHWTGYKHEQA